MDKKWTRECDAWSLHYGALAQQNSSGLMCDFWPAFFMCTVSVLCNLAWGLERKGFMKGRQGKPKSTKTCPKHVRKCVEMQGTVPYLAFTLTVMVAAVVLTHWVALALMVNELGPCLAAWRIEKNKQKTTEFVFQKKKVLKPCVLMFSTNTLDKFPSLTIFSNTELENKKRHLSVTGRPHTYGLTTVVEDREPMEGRLFTLQKRAIGKCPSGQKKKKRKKRTLPGRVYVHALYNTLDVVEHSISLLHSVDWSAWWRKAECRVMAVVLVECVKTTEQTPVSMCL